MLESLVVITEDFNGDLWYELIVYTYHDDTDEVEIKS